MLEFPEISSEGEASSWMSVVSRRLAWTILQQGLEAPPAPSSHSLQLGRQGPISGVRSAVGGQWFLGQGLSEEATGISEWCPMEGGGVGGQRPLETFPMSHQLLGG